MGLLNNKLLSLGVVFVLSSFLYFSMFNQFVLENKRSSAAHGQVTVSFHETNVTIANQATDPVPVNVFFNTDDLLSSGAISFLYSPELRYDNPVPGNDVISATCAANGFVFKQLLAVNFDDTFGGGHISRSVDPSNNAPGALPSGFFCYSTLTFRFKNQIALPSNATIKFWDPQQPQCDPNSPQYNPLCHWEIVGPDGSGQPVAYTPVLDPNKSSVTVSIGGSVIPSAIPTPVMDPNACRTLPYPPAVPNPSGSTVVMPLAQACGDKAIYNQILAAITACFGPTSLACANWDFNGDGIINQKDYDLFVQMCWCVNNGYGPGDLVPTTTPTPLPTAVPTLRPTATPTPIPTAVPTLKPTATPTPLPALPTATPVLPTVTRVPTGGNCPRYQEGDFSCDGKVNLVDFNQWLGAYITHLQTGFTDPYYDLNNDGKPSLPEFETIRSHFDFS